MDIRNIGAVVRDFTAPNHISSDPLPRDRSQSARLHEPEQILVTSDPITGREIEELEGSPYIVDGNVVIYFQSDATRRLYQSMPIDHPVHLPDNPLEEGYAEG